MTQELIATALAPLDTAIGFPWFALRVRANCEKLTGELLRKKGYEEFSPLYRLRRQWSDRVKVVEMPLFSGYVFCRFDVHRRLPILTTPGVVTIVNFGGIPAEIDEAEISAIQTILVSGRLTLPWPYLKVGQRVRVTSGPLRGVEGLLTQMKDELRMVVSVTLLQRSVSVEIDREDVEPILQ